MASRNEISELWEKLLHEETENLGYKIEEDNTEADHKVIS
jgi:hypothetical protein